MPEDAIDKKLTELTSPTVYTDIGNSDYLFVAHYDSANQEYVNLKVSVTEFASKILKNIEFTSDLETTSKIIINAINEAAQSGGTGGASSLGELTDVTITSPSTGQVLTYDATSGKWVNGAGAELALTSEVIGSIASFNDGADNQPLKSWKTTITPIQTGTGTPSPSNVRPLSGRTQVVASQGGANLYDYTTDTTNRYYKSDGSTDSSTSWRCSDYIEVTPSLKVIAKGLDSGSTSGSHYLCLYKQDKSFSRSILISANTDIIISVASDEYYIRTSVRKANDEYLTANVFEVVDEKTISLGTSVYGGELDIISGSGKIQYGIVTLDGTEAWQSYNSGNGFSTEISTMKTGSYMNGWSNMFTASSDSSEMHVVLGSSNANKRVYFSQVKSIEGVSDLNSWKTWLSNNNVQLVYPLATEVDLTAQGEDFNTLEGINQFYTDCGISDVVYFNSMVDDVVDICEEVIASKEKVLTGTLTAGNTSLTLSDSAITTDSTIDIYTDTFGVNPTNAVVATGSVTLTFAAQQSNLGVKVVVK